MRKLGHFTLFLIFIFIFTGNSFAFLGNSLRLRAMGEELSGFIVDEYSDIHRNPAYLNNIKNLRIFVQHNTYGYTELKIAPFMRNEDAGLGGIVIPVSRYGTWSLVGELRPSSSENSSAPSETRYDYLDRYVVYNESSKELRKYTVRNFKTIYSLKISSEVILGLDFTYLKNYDYRNSVSNSSREETGLSEDSLINLSLNSQINISNSSPDAQRGSLGLMLFPQKRWSLDLTLFYEHLGYVQRYQAVSDNKSFYDSADTTLTGYTNNSSTPVEEKAYSLEGDLKYHYSDDMIFSLIWGIKYIQNKNSSSGYYFGNSYFAHDTLYQLSEIRDSSSNYNKDKSLNFDLGIGIERDFSPSVKVAIGAKGYWDRVKLNRYETRYYMSRQIRNDTTISFSSTSVVSEEKRTTNSLSLALPIGLEAKLHSILKVRLGGMWLIKYEEYSGGHSTSSSSSYNLGLGFSLQDQIYMDAYIRNTVEELKNWMVNIGYNF